MHRETLYFRLHMQRELLRHYGLQKREAERGITHIQKEIRQTLIDIKELGDDPKKPQQDNFINGSGKAKTPGEEST